VASAGHLSPFWNERELNLPGAFPLGLVSAIAYEETTLQLSCSDHLAVYTDGLLEARSDSGELYGFDRLNALFATKPTAEQATEAAVAFGQDDDITVLILTRQAVN
jgi:serine phosphatase RsbU (regulator of sigma subunit)